MPITRADMVLGTVDELVAASQADKVGNGQIRDVSSGAKDVVLVFRTQKDGRVRPEHAALEGRVWELDDPDAPSPPLAPNCRCEVILEARGSAIQEEASTPAESLQKFKKLENNLEQVYPLDVVQAYANGDLLPRDIIIPRTGDRITTDQARAIIASRIAEVDPKSALKAVAQLADYGMSGRVMSPIVADARARIASGTDPMAAALAAIRATIKRGLVTERNIQIAAEMLVRSRLLDGVDITG